MADGAPVMEEMDDEECIALLGRHRFGRLAVVVEGAPLVFPVNYVFSGGRVAIRTDEGSKLTAAALGQVAFEIDEADPSDRTGWSVIVRGVGFDITDSIDQISESMREFPVETWAPGAKAHWIRIEPSSVSGRRVRRS